MPTETPKSEKYPTLRISKEFSFPTTKQKILGSVLVIFGLTFIIIFGGNLNDNVKPLRLNTSQEVNALPGNQTSLIMTMLFNDDYFLTAAVLGHSLNLVNTTIPKSVGYFAKNIKQKTKCKLRKLGFKLVPIEPIEPPGKGNNARYDWTFTKFRIWTLTEYKQVLYLDSDILAVKNFDELFSKDIEFGAALDIWFDTPSTTLNAGVLLVKPSIETFNDMLKHAKEDLLDGQYDINMMDQVALFSHS